LTVKGLERDIKSLQGNTDSLSSLRKAIIKEICHGNGNYIDWVLRTKNRDELLVCSWMILRETGEKEKMKIVESLFKKYTDSKPKTATNI
jgi:hypothetical protein